MKVLVLLLLVVCVGCGGSKEKVAPKSQALERTTSEIEPKAKVMPKAEVKEPLTEEESGKIIETAIRKQLKKPTGELTKTDLEKVTFLESQLQSTDLREGSGEAPTVKGAVSR